MNRVLAVSLDELRPAQAIESFPELVNLVVKNAVVLAGIISFLLLVFGGLAVIMGAGGGDTKRIEQGQKTIVGAVVGLLLVVGSVWIMQLIGLITGVSLPF